MKENDTISRQTAIDALKAIKIGLWEIDIPHPGNCPEYIEHHKQIQEMMGVVGNWIERIKALPTAEPVSNWIPCGESLPDQDYCTISGIQYSSEVLATVINHGADDETFVDMLVMVDGEWKIVHPIDGSNDIADWCEVVAWMPLPESYKEG